MPLPMTGYGKRVFLRFRQAYIYIIQGYGIAIKGGRTPVAA
jgi:hypothetical protein